MNDPKVFRLGIGNDLEYFRSDMGLGLKGQFKVRVRDRLGVQQYGVGSNSVSVFYTLFQKKMSQYTFPHIFSTRGTILTIFAVLMPQ